MNFYLLVLISTIFYTAGNVFGKFWTEKPSWQIFALTLVFYLFASSFFVFALKKSSLSVAIGIMPLATTIAGLAFAYFYFGERLSALQYFGVALAIAAIFVLTFPFEAFQK